MHRGQALRDHDCRLHSFAIDPHRVAARRSARRRRRAAPRRLRRRARVGHVRGAVPTLPPAAGALPAPHAAARAPDRGSPRRHAACRVKPGRALQRHQQGVDLDLRDSLAQGAEGTVAARRPAARCARGRAAAGRRRRASRGARSDRPGVARAVGRPARRGRTDLLPRLQLPGDRADRRVLGRHRQDAHAPRPQAPEIGGRRPTR
jgi:hypothetical protein